jgi:hypothetical protein
MIPPDTQLLTKLAMVIWACARLVFEIPHISCTSTWQPVNAVPALTWKKVKGVVIWVSVCRLKICPVSRLCGGLTFEQY